MALESYVIIAPDGTVDNVCLWDGVTPWSPPEGYTVQKQTDPRTQAKGFRLVDGVFERIPVETENDPA
jgi:hypothetical protein